MHRHGLFRAVLVILAGCVAGGASARADLVTYTDQAAYLTAAGPNTTLEGFESLAASAQGTTAIDTPTFVVTPGPAEIGIRDSSIYDAHATDGTKFLLSYRQGLTPGTLIFDFKAPTDSFAFVITDYFEVAGSLVISTNAGETLTPFTALSAPPTLGSGNERFFGFIQSTPFTQLTLTADGLDDAFGLDSIRVRTVPEPSALLALGLGGAIAFAARRRMR